MKDFLDRQPTRAGRRKITHEDGRTEFVTVEMADEPTVAGTPLNRKAFMEIQGFGYNHTVFNEDGSIAEYNENGEPLLTHFNGDGTIDETFTNVDGLAIKQKTEFNEDGTITTAPVELETEEV